MRNADDEHKLSGFGECAYCHKQDMPMSKGKVVKKNGSRGFMCHLCLKEEKVDDK